MPAKRIGAGGKEGEGFTGFFLASGELKIDGVGERRLEASEMDLDEWVGVQGFGGWVHENGGGRPLVVGDAGGGWMIVTLEIERDIG